MRNPNFFLGFLPVQVLFLCLSVCLRIMLLMKGRSRLVVFRKHCLFRGTSILVLKLVPSLLCFCFVVQPHSH